MLDRLQRTLAWIAPPEGTPIEAWRRRILAAVLLGVCLLGSVAYAVGAGAAYRAGQHSVIVVDTICFVLIIAITVGRGLPYAVRAGVLAVLPGMLGTFFLYGWGFMAAGFPWLLAFPIFASVLLGTRAGLWAFGATSAILVALGLLLPTGLMPWAVGMPGAELMWWVSTSSVLMLAGIVSMSTGYLFDGLGREAEARQAAVREADRRERLAALGTLTGGIAHDFNNLLQPIVSDAEHARRLVDDQHAAQPLLDDILRSAHRARTLVRRILSFARPLAEGEREVVDLGALVQESERLLRAVLPTNVRLVTRIETPVQVVAEAAELQQVLLNLVSNAAHAMLQGGRVDIQVTEVPGGAEFAETALAEVERIGLITVSDTGAGMNRETLERAFEPFFTTKLPGRGTGLGLATVHATVATLGGMVRADSEVGVGTRMRVWLPAATGSAPDVSSIARLSASTEVSTSAHIVVVDDEPAVLMATARLIERLGYTVSRFDQPTQLLATFDTLSPPPQLVLSDLSMPEYSGWELAAALHARHPDLPIVMMTGNLEVGEVDAPATGNTTDSDALQSKRIRSGVRAVLSKPFTSAELRAALQRCLT